jgi:hypothetical protein
LRLLNIKINISNIEKKNIFYFQYNEKKTSGFSGRIGTFYRRHCRGFSTEKCECLTRVFSGEPKKKVFLRTDFDDRINTLLTLHIHINNNKADLLSKIQSLKCNSFGFIQNIKLLQIHIHEQYFILSWICYKVCHNEWYEKD